VDDPQSGIGQFMFAALEAPFTPKRYLELIKEAAKPGRVIVVDTLSQEWAGEGGTLETHDNMGGNSYTNWGKVNPPHYELINWITQKAPCHTIVNLRSKIKHEQTKDEQTGRQVVTVLGEGPIARPGTEYEFHITFALERETFRATPITKRGSMLPDMRPVELTVDLGQRLRAWAETGTIVETLDQSSAVYSAKSSGSIPMAQPLRSAGRV